MRVPLQASPVHGAKGNVSGMMFTCVVRRGATGDVWRKVNKVMIKIRSGRDRQ